MASTISRPLAGVKAFLFDAFGTTVDWRSTVTNFLHQRCQTLLNTPNDRMSPSVRAKAEAMTLKDWGIFAAEWRATYYAYTKHVVQDKVQEPKSIDEHHLGALRNLLQDRGLQGFWHDAAIKDISLIWHNLDPWPDTTRGLALLKQKYQICTLSNGNTSLLSDMAQHASLPWSHIFSAADFGTFKPDPRVYLGAAEKLGLKPEECGMIAAHLGDLKAAKGCGYRTVYVERGQEEAWSEREIDAARTEGWVDVWIKLRPDEGKDGGFVEVARRLGILG